MGFVGIDVSKLQLDIAVRPDTKKWSVVNSEADIAELIKVLKELSPQVIVIEATGGIGDAFSSGLKPSAVAGGGCQSSTGAGFCQGSRPFGQDR